jgi:molybdenum cofactor biosynthesis protein B
MGAESHRQLAGQRSVTAAILTISDTRTPETDKSGQAMRRLLEAAGHQVGFYAVVKDEPAEIRGLVERLATAQTVQVLLLNGGTGISRRDSTYETVSQLLEKRLDGFGELFRMLSYQEIGAAAILSRAVAGVYRGMVLFSTPGSPGAVQLAMEKLILPELAHLVWELRR